MTMSLPPIFRPWYREDRNFAVNSEACIMFQELPSHCRLAGIRSPNTPNLSLIHISEPTRPY